MEGPRLRLPLCTAWTAPVHMDHLRQRVTPLLRRVTWCAETRRVLPSRPRKHPQAPPDHAPWPTGIYLSTLNIMREEVLDPGNRCQCTTKASACSVTFFVTAGTIRHYGIDLQMLLDKAQYSMIKFFVLDVFSCRGVAVSIDPTPDIASLNPSSFNRSASYLTVIVGHLSLQIR